MVRVRIRLFVGAALACCGVWAAPALAQTPPPVPVAPPQAQVQQVKEELDRLRQEFDALRRAYGDRLSALEERLAQLGDAAAAVPRVPESPVAAAPPPGALPPAAPAGQAPASTGSPSALGKVFNPDISVNGNFVGAAGSNPFATLPAFQLSEVEAAFRAAVDPYARADFFFAVSPEGIDVEEGYITFTSLPARLLLKAGKMRAQFGKENTLHTHGLATVDRPIVTQNLVGGEEGLSDAGFSVSRLIANPWVFLEAVGEVYAGQSDVFQATERSRLVYLGRVRAYRDLNESNNLEIGGSAVFGPATVDAPVPVLFDPDAAPLQATDQDKRLLGIDATFRYRPLERARYRSLNLRTELIWSRQQMPDASAQQAFGMYVRGEYQFARRWYVGGRADRSGRVTDGSAIDTGGSVFLTFWPTEYSQIRGQFRHIRFATGERANEFLFQFNFSIGAHGAHVF